MSNIQGAAAPVTPHADDELLTIQEVADLVRVPVATLRYWRHVGTGPRSFRIGRSVRYWRTEVFAWLDNQANSDRQSVLRLRCASRQSERCNRLRSSSRCAG